MNDSAKTPRYSSFGLRSGLPIRFQDLRYWRSPPEDDQMKYKKDAYGHWMPDDTGIDHAYDQAIWCDIDPSGGEMRFLHEKAKMNGYPTLEIINLGR